MQSELDRLRQKLDDMATLIEANATIAQEMKLDRVLLRLAQQAVSLTSAEIGMLWFPDEQQHLAPVVILGPGNRDHLAHLRLVSGEGVAGRAFETGQALLITDPSNHPRWDVRFDETSGVTARSVICAPLVARGRRLGALQMVNRTQSGGHFDDDMLEVLTVLANLGAISLDNALMLQQANTLSTSLFDLITTALDARDPHSSGHSAKVAEQAVSLGRFMGLQPDELDRLRRAALLHDIGKVAVPDHILRKVVAKTPEEEKVLQSHPVAGAELLTRVRPQSAVTDAILVARQHHERYDGQGYPEGLPGEQMALFSRIVAVADRFVRLTTNKPPHRALPENEALGEIERLGGSELDPSCAAAFIELMVQNG